MAQQRIDLEDPRVACLCNSNRGKAEDAFGETQGVMLRHLSRGARCRIPSNSAIARLSGRKSRTRNSWVTPISYSPGEGTKQLPCGGKGMPVKRARDSWESGRAPRYPVSLSGASLRRSWLSQNANAF